VLGHLRGLLGLLRVCRAVMWCVTSREVVRSCA
jgi:hypothetical protein